MQQGTISDFSKCVGGECPLKTTCTRFTTPDVLPPNWQPYYIIVPYKDGACEMHIAIVAEVNNG